MTDYKEYDYMDEGLEREDRAHLEGLHIFIAKDFAEDFWPDGRVRCKLNGTLITGNGFPLNINLGDFPTKQQWNEAGKGQKQGMTLNKNIRKSLEEIYDISLEDMRKSGAPRGVEIGVNTYLDKNNFPRVNKIVLVADAKKAHESGGNSKPGSKF